MDLFMVSIITINDIVVASLHFIPFGVRAWGESMEILQVTSWGALMLLQNYAIKHFVHVLKEIDYPHPTQRKKV